MDIGQYFTVRERLAGAKHITDHHYYTDIINARTSDICGACGEAERAEDTEESGLGFRD
jgi:hypothetical protein